MAVIRFGGLLSDASTTVRAGDRAAAERAMQAIPEMTGIDIAALERGHANETDEG